MPARTCAQLSEYFAGQRRVFDLPIDWTVVSRQQCQVLSVLFDSVGYGETITYGALGRRAGAAADAIALPARAIGQIMGSNPVPVIVPCHRVVAGNGLGGFSGGIGPELRRWTGPRPACRRDCLPSPGRSDVSGMVTLCARQGAPGGMQRPPG